MDYVDEGDLGGGSTNGLGSCSHPGTCTSNNHPDFSDTPESYFSPIFTKRDSSEKKLMSPSDKPTGEVTDAVDLNDFGSGSTVGLSCGNTNGPGSS